MAGAVEGEKPGCQSSVWVVLLKEGGAKGILARNLSLHLSLLSFDRREVALDFVIERKRTDDLASSIVDGRFREQKQRLLNSSARFPIYVIEHYGTRSQKHHAVVCLLVCVCVCL